MANILKNGQKRDPKRYLRVFILMIIISPPLSFTAHSIIHQDRPVWFHILYGLVTGIFFVILVYFQDKRKEKKERE
jgi:hypothetical protein